MDPNAPQVPAPPTQTAALPYDVSSLGHGIFFEGVHGDARYGVAIVLVVFAAMMLPTLVVSLMPSSLVNVQQALRLIYTGVVPIAIWGFVIYSVVGTWIRQWLYRRAVQQFALANNLTPAPDQELFQHIPPSLQQEGAHSQKVAGYYFTFGANKAVIFDYSYSVGSGKQRRDYAFAVACLLLPKQYPHLFLDGHANGQNDRYAASQRIELEGDFNQYFDLYMPEGSEAGALTVFAPDVMQTLIEQGQPFDLELQGYDVAIMTKGYAFTRDNFQRFVSCSSALSKEFAELDNTWRPVLTAAGKPFVLKRRSALLRTLLVIAIYFIFYAIFVLVRAQPRR